MNLLSRNSKRHGELAELAFLYKASSLGYVVAKPYGDSLPYDFLVDASSTPAHRAPHSRLPLRVQVKSVSSSYRGLYRISSGCGHRHKTPYSPSDVDILAAYVVPCDAWYLIPVRDLHGVLTIGLCPHRPSRRRFEPYREAWTAAFGPPLLTLHASADPSAHLPLSPACDLPRDEPRPVASL